MGKVINLLEFKNRKEEAFREMLQGMLKNCDDILEYMKLLAEFDEAEHSSGDTPKKENI